MRTHPTTTHETSTDQHLQGWAYALLAFLFGVVGICASAVTADFFIVGLLKLEADETARSALIAAGVLMIVAEVLAFGVAGLLPRAQMGSLRRKLIAFGLALLAFEIVTIYVTQVALAQTSNAQAQSTQTRIKALESSIAGQLASAAALRTNADRQTASTYSWVRIEGAKSLKAAVELEALAAKQGIELAELQTTQHPTMTDILGHQGMVGYSVARALLISVVGIMMCAAAGALLRARRSANAAVITNAAANAAPAPLLKRTELPSTANILPPLFAKGSFSYAWIAQVATIGTVAIPAQAQTVQVVTKPAAVVAQAQKAMEATTTPVQSPKNMQGAVVQSVHRAAMQDTGTGNQDGTRFQRVREAILAQEITPSLRSIWGLAGASQRVAQRYLEAMEMAGEIERGSKGYKLVRQVKTVNPAPV